MKFLLQRIRKVNFYKESKSNKKKKKKNMAGGRGGGGVWLG